MKHILFVISFLFSLNTVGQSFNGVNISGDLSTTVKSFEQKGYKLSRYFQQGAIMNGSVAGSEIEIYIGVTPKSKQVWKVTGFFKKHENWYNLKAEYNNYCGIIKDKYGPYTDNYEFFSSPYESGDGYEMQALRLEKATFITVWTLKEQNLTIGVELSKYQQVKISYENIKMVEIKNKEQSEIEAESF
jgi:hypothetical protein